MSEPETDLEETESLPLLASPRAPIALITTPKELSVALEVLAGCDGPIAVDAERASGFKYSQRAYLIQVKGLSTNIFLIDPVSDPNLQDSEEFQRLREVLGSKSWILHAATQDLPCLAELGLNPREIFDTELAARLAGEPRVGLGPLTENLLGFRLAKEHSAADWSIRPLPKEWLNYAALDVDVLHELLAVETKLLNDQNKFAWAKEEFQNLLQFKPKPPKRDKWRGISGIHKIQDRRSLEVCRLLWQAREELAKKMDIAPGRLIPDSSIVAVATAKIGSRSELASMKTFTGRASRTYLDHWWEAVFSASKSANLPELKPEKTDALPSHRTWATKFPEADKRLKYAKAALDEVSKMHKIPLENLLTPDLLRQVCFAPPGDGSISALTQRLSELGARNWQIELTASSIVEAISLAEKVQDDPQAVDPLERDERGAL